MYKSKSRKKRRRVTLTLVGVLIGFLTYIAKDLVQEHTKDTTNAIQSAQTVYRSEIEQATSRIDQMSFRMVDLLNELKAFKKSEKNIAFKREKPTELFLARNFQSDRNNRLDAVSRLLDQLPCCADDLKQRRDELRTTFGETDQRFSKLTDVSAVMELGKDSAEPTISEIAGLQIAILTLSVQDGLAGTLGNLALSRAQSIQERTEKRYRITVWISCFLILLGALLTLYANLSGQEVPRE